MTATGTAARTGLLASAFRDAFRHHPTGVAVVTARDGAGGPVGLTASSVASVSLSPPALVLSISHRASAAAALLAADWFLVHLLEARNVELAMRFATSDADRFGPATGWTPLATGEPWFPEAPTALRCRPLTRTPVGDATVVTAEVVGVRSSGRAGMPLIHHDRGYHVLGPALPVS
ncbi:flavin reductase family protein [Pseudonocardia sp. DSM 110487]|uniref:flavin reductase family protein n=1 Tax=Pseudonocardia sp. DSM 110487 TaxID=2865833 RepID=UPI001C695D4D|nr:flavin reductase family protein [Pseudonocardia sp. DSM 110487]QYN32267.1 flavin reductase family protein [Pseudonocardia sp. DSM 110487]